MTADKRRNVADINQTDSDNDQNFANNYVDQVSELIQKNRL